MDIKHAKEKNEIIDFANDVIENKNNYIILDTETTGLGDNDVIVQIGIIDIDGNILMDTLIRPTKKNIMDIEATALHRITMEMLKDAPTFAEVAPQLYKVIDNKKVLIYNAEYHLRIMRQTAKQDNIRLKDIPAFCIMLAFSIFVGAWS